MLRRIALALALLGTSVVAFAQSHIADVIYGHKYGVATTMDVFKPEKPNHIAVVFIVSGGWVSDYKSLNPFLAKIFTDRGMTVFEVLHGSQPKFQMPDILSDIYRSVRFIRANAATYDIDPNKIGVSGASAGGHLSLMLGAYGSPGNPDAADPVERAGSQVNAIACFFPPVDMLNWGETGKAALDSPVLKVFWPAFGITDQTPRDLVLKMGQAYSPIYGVTPKFPPTLVFHGDADPIVPLQQSELLMKKLEELGVPHELVVRKGAGHGYPAMLEDFVKCADWFMKYLGKQ
jgi:acetyl esterase/lipase